MRLECNVQYNTHKNTNMSTPLVQDGISKVVEVKGSVLKDPADVLSTAHSKYKSSMTKHWGKKVL